MATLVASNSKKRSHKAKGPRSPVSDAVLKVWKPWKKQLCEIDDVVQTSLNDAYRHNLLRFKMKFDVGDKVLSLSAGLYYSGITIAHYRSVMPDTLFPANTPFDGQSSVPTYMVRFDGWSYHHNEEVAENELIRRETRTFADIQGMLFAHEWNLYHREELNVTEEEMGHGVWFLEDNMYSQLERLWQQESGATVRFREFCGRSDEYVAIKNPSTHSP